ncbi:MAG: hypothetical protein DRH08_13425, partial [Deltaproteobacteria bacterium]
DLGITIDDGSVSTIPGGAVSYSLSYWNNGRQNATGVEVTVIVPANSSFDSGASTAGWAVVPDGSAGSLCTFTVGDLAGGGSGSITLVFDVENPLSSGVTQLSVTADIADDGCGGSDPVPGDNSDGDTTPIMAAPDLQITKDDGGISAQPGDTVAYTLTYANFGNQNATGVEISETVPADSSFNAGASTAGWACVPDSGAGSVCTLSLGSLIGGGGSSSVTFAINIDNPLAAGVTEISNAAGIDDDGNSGPDSTPGDNTDFDTTPVTGAPDLQITKDDGGLTSIPGSTVSYTLTYSNVGDQNATGIEITDTVPANTVFNAGSSTSGWACVPDAAAGAFCTLALGSLSGGGGNGSATFAVDVDDPLAAGVTLISNTADIADDGNSGPDSTPSDNTGSDDTPVTAAPDLRITKDDGGILAEPGQTVSYTLTYSNVGDQDATGVEITDTVPANTNFNAGASTGGWVCVPDAGAGSVCGLTLGNLVGGASAGIATIAFDVDVPFPLGVSEVSNTADIADDGNNGPDSFPADNSDSDSTPIVPNPSLNITKADALSDDADLSGDVTAGDTLTYTVEVTNNGDVEVANVVFNDAPDANTTLVNGSVISSAGSVMTGNGAADTTVEIDLGNLLFSETGTISFDVIINDPVPAGVTLLSNQGFASADHIPGEPTDDPDTPQADDSTDTLIGTAPQVDVLKTDLLVIDGDASGGLSAGDTIEYTVTVMNSGNADADTVVFTDTPGGGTALVVGSVTTGQGSVTTGNGGGDIAVEIDLGVLAPDASVTITFRVMLDDPMPAGQMVISNQGLVTSAGDPSGESTDDPDTQAEDDPTDSPLSGNPDLEATKTDSLLVDANGDGMVGPGDTIRYLMSITNNGDSDATGVTLADIPNTNTALLVGSVVTSFGTVTTGNAGGDTDVNIDIGDVAAGDSVSITFDVIVDDPLAACIETINNQG